MTDLPLRREERTMKDPKKQAQARARHRHREEAQEELNERYGKKRSRLYTVDDWLEISEGMEVITDPEEMKVFAGYLVNRLWGILINTIWDFEKGAARVKARVHVLEERPVIRLEVNNRVFPEALYGQLITEGVRFGEYSESGCIDIILERLVRNKYRWGLPMKHDELNLKFVDIANGTSLRRALRDSLSFIVEEYIYANIPEDGVLCL